jgi:hypothetical protein
MRDVKHIRYTEPVPLEVKLVHGAAFITVILALIVGACL